MVRKKIANLWESLCEHTIQGPHVQAADSHAGKGGVVHLVELLVQVDGRPSEPGELRHMQQPVIPVEEHLCVCVGLCEDKTRGDKRRETL